jgi:hypothetical protein
MKTTAIVISTFLFLCFTAPLRAQDPSTKNNKARYSIEIDPATFLFSGYGVHFRIQPKNCSHLLLGAGAYAMDMPDPLVKMNANNKDKGWSSRLNQGYGLFAEHHFTEVNKGWFIGSQLGIQEYKIENSQVPANNTYTNLLLMLQGGYSWSILKSDFYIKPWAGFGYTTQISGSNRLGTQEYDIAPVALFATLHLGYTF